jgi:hypothetical protein
MMRNAMAVASSKWECRTDASWSKIGYFTFNLLQHRLLGVRSNIGYTFEGSVDRRQERIHGKKPPRSRRPAAPTYRKF